MRELIVEPLTAEAFAPFGEVIQFAGAQHYPINQGLAERYHDLARVDVAAEGGRALINLFRAQPRALPLEIRLLERHPLGSQAFLPLSEKPWLVVVAPPGEFDPARIRAFVTRGWQGVNYARGTWHHPLIALGSVSEFIVIDRGGEGNNLHEEHLAEPLEIRTVPGWLEGV